MFETERIAAETVRRRPSAETISHGFVLAAASLSGVSFTMMKAT
jgi:hypothetical protein